MTSSRRAWLARVATVLVLGLAACGGGSGSTKVSVELREFEITPNRLSVPAGSVSFAVRNVGGLLHEMVVVLTDLPPERLPTTSDGRFDPRGAGVRVVAAVSSVAPRAAKTRTLRLGVGRYVLLCNIPAEPTEGTPAHFAEHMHATFQVTRT